MSSQKGHLEVVTLLLAKGAKVNEATNDGGTPFLAGSQYGHQEVVKLLLAKGAKVDKAMNDGRTVLFSSRQTGHKEVAKLLMANGRKAVQAEKKEEEGGKEEGNTKKAARVCENCDKEASKMQKCSRCRLVRYCSQNCQLADWKEHKKTWKKAAARKKGGKGS